MDTLLDHALRYYDNGLAVVPIGTGEEGKGPLNKNWSTVRLIRPQLESFFTNGCDPIGIGFIAGEMSGNRAVLDFDEGWEHSLENYLYFWSEHEHAPLWTTAHGRRQMMLHIPDLPADFTKTVFRREGQIIELRGNRHNCVLPPSLHVGCSRCTPETRNNRYEWLTDIAEIPAVKFWELYDWLAEWATETESPYRPGETSEYTPEALVNGHAGTRAPLPKISLEFLAEPGLLPDGERNDRLYAASQQFYAAGYPLDEAIAILEPVALRIGLDGKEIQPTIKSGYVGAKKAGFKPIRKPTHDELAERWLVENTGTVFGLGDWRRYQKGLWLVVSEFVIKREVKRILQAAKSEGIQPTDGMITSVANLAKYEVVTADEIWDADPDYLVCGNGTLHIPTRTLGEHRPELYATSGVAYDYEPNAKAEAWAAYLFDLAVNTSQCVVDFLQEFAGYALTTDTSYEIALWLYGAPGSGKSTLLSGFEKMLGSRAGLLGLADIERSRFALANLPGKTLAIATEQPSSFLASTDVLNAIISGETITVDRKFRDAVQLVPRAKIAWGMNELPRVSDPNSGLFRRVKVVELRAIPEADRDPQLKKQIKTEGAGILNWALDGLDRLRERGGFEIPPEVITATDDFKATNDVPRQFVEDCCVTGTDANGEPYRVQTSNLYDAYKQWCLDTGHKSQSSTSIANDWKRLGFEKRRPGGVVHWFNVGLKAD